MLLPQGSIYRLNVYRTNGTLLGPDEIEDALWWVKLAMLLMLAYDGRAEWWLPGENQVYHHPCRADVPMSRAPR